MAANFGCDEGDCGWGWMMKWLWFKSIELRSVMFYGLRRNERQIWHSAVINEPL